MLFWLAFGVPAAYWPGMPEAVQVAKWAVIAASPLMLLWLRPRWSIIHTLAVLLIAWAAFTLLWAPSLPHAADALCKMALGFVLFVIGYETDDLERFWIGCALGLMPSALIAIAQACGIFIIEDAWSLPPGLFGNPNLMGEFAALVLIGLALQGAWVWMPTALTALVLAQARGAFLAVIATTMIAKPRLGAALVIVLALGVTFSVQRNLASTDSLRERMTIWRDAGSALTPIGSGIGSFETVMRAHTSRPTKIVQHAHNDALELAIELGIPGIVLAAMLLLLIAGRARNAERLVLAALAIEAMFGFPLHNPGTVFIGAVVAGHAARGFAVVRLRELVGGPPLQRRHA